jgi:hypothetical protein
MRMRVGDLDLSDPATASEFERCSEIMRNVLIKKNSRKDADRIIALTFEAAADHQLESLRRDRFVDDFERSKNDLSRLIKQIDHLANAISALPPMSVGKTQRDYCQAELAVFRCGNVFRAYARDGGCAVRTIPGPRSK